MILEVIKIVHVVRNVAGKFLLAETVSNDGMEVQSVMLDCIHIILWRLPELEVMYRLKQ